MTVLFVLATLTLFLTLDHFVQRARTRKAAQQVTERLVALGQAFQPIPDGVRLRGNHTWVKDDAHGIITVGLDEFLAKFLGALESIAVPQSGALVNPETRGITLEDRGKAITLSSPVTGKVVSINHDVLRSPSLAAMDPYGRGWLMKIQAEKKGEGMIGAEAMQWLREQTDAAREFFTVRREHGALAFAQDGGEPVAGLMKQYDAAAWKEFQQQFLGQQDGANERVSLRSNQ
jgi:glycine cleavage system H protein